MISTSSEIFQQLIRGVYVIKFDYATGCPLNPYTSEVSWIVYKFYDNNHSDISRTWLKPHYFLTSLSLDIYRNKKWGQIRY